MSGWANRGYTVEVRPTPLREPGPDDDLVVAQLQLHRELAGRSPTELGHTARGPYRCGACGKLGHNRQLCPKGVR